MAIIANLDMAINMVLMGIYSNCIFMSASYSHRILGKLTYSATFYVIKGREQKLKWWSLNIKISFGWNNENEIIS